MLPALPPQDLLQQQANWLAPARARLLRRAAIAHRRFVLDLGAGYGLVTAELARRSSGTVLALDSSQKALGANPGAFAGAGRLCGMAQDLPFKNNLFDLVFCQVVLMWLTLPAVIPEIWRVLQPGGLLIALEPDYGGMIEHPPPLATRDLWISALQRAGADPFVGRKLPEILAKQGFKVKVDLLPEMVAPASPRFDLLRGLGLTTSEEETLQTIEAEATRRSEQWGNIAHLPFVLITATRQT